MLGSPSVDMYPCDGKLTKLLNSNPVEPMKEHTEALTPLATLGRLTGSLRRPQPYTLNGKGCGLGFRVS